MNADASKLAADRELLLAAEAKGGEAKLRAFAKLSGPGWLQSALTLGGGTLAGSLYLGVLSGPHLLWLQPVAMALGVIMTSAIGYVTLSTREKPLDAVSRYINPVMAWGWAHWRPVWFGSCPSMRYQTQSFSRFCSRIAWAPKASSVKRVEEW